VLAEGRVKAPVMARTPFKYLILALSVIECQMISSIALIVLTN
jgi:hypothetical protein